MKKRILDASIESLRREGLRFSVDTLAEQLKISKKTIYKYFPDKETLALALYEAYYSDAIKRAGQMIEEQATRWELLMLYYDSKIMIRSEIFNKFKLNASVYSYATEQNDALWGILAPALWGGGSDGEDGIVRLIVDGTFEKLCDAGADPHRAEQVTERLVMLL